MDGIQRAIVLSGGQTSLARLIGVTQGAVYQWANGLRRVPAERCLEIERVTQGVVRCEDLRPDLGWSVLRCKDHKKARAA